MALNAMFQPVGMIDACVSLAPAPVVERIKAVHMVLIVSRRREMLCRLSSL